MHILGRASGYLRSGQPPLALRKAASCLAHVRTAAAFPAHSTDNKKNRIIPRHIQLAIRNDEELGKLLGDVTIAAVGQNVLGPGLRACWVAGA